MCLWQQCRQPGTYTVLVVTPLGNLREDGGDGSRDDAPVNIPLRSSRDCEGLARSGLAIGKDGAIVTLHSPHDHRPGDSLKHL